MRCDSADAYIRKDAKIFQRKNKGKADSWRRFPFRYAVAYLAVSSMLSCQL